MTVSQTRHSLKQNTDGLHLKVDAAFGAFDLNDEAGIEGFLTAQAAALMPLEHALETACDGALPALLPDWADRRRSQLLGGIGLDIPSLPVPAFGTQAGMLGALYVLEGSKLGARFLLKRLTQAEGRFARAAIRFLAHDTGSGRWASFLQLLDRHVAPADGTACLAGATTAFALFEAAARTVAGLPCRPWSVPKAGFFVGDVNAIQNPSIPALKTVSESLN